MPAGLSKTELENAVKSNENVIALISDLNIVKTITVPDKLVNFVAK